MMLYLDGVFIASFLPLASRSKQQKDADDEEDDEEEEEHSPRSDGERFPHPGAFRRQQIAQHQHVAHSPPHRRVARLQKKKTTKLTTEDHRMSVIHLKVVVFLPYSERKCQGTTRRQSRILSATEL